MRIKTIVLIISLFVSVCWAKPHDQASLQKGAALFMNYCSGCHSLKYLHYNRMAEDLGIQNPELLKKNLIFTQAQAHDPIQTALPLEDAQQWFGLMPPDLSLIARQKGIPWLHDYLTGFYQDKSRPYGVNNVLEPNEAMPDVLESLRVSGPHQNQLDDIKSKNFEQAIADLLHFLAYAGEPVQSARQHLGLFVIPFLILLLVFVYYLKKCYWKGVKRDQRS
jgi:ubiquinol-cytochrome c reductase cytochrome c1 subunit